MLDMVEKKEKYYGYKNVKELNADFTTNEIQEREFDLILSMPVLHYVKEIDGLIELNGLKENFIKHNYSTIKKQYKELKYSLYLFYVLKNMLKIKTDKKQ